VLRDLDQKRLTTEAAGRLLGLERHQVFRPLKAYRTESPPGLILKRRGRRSDRRKPEPQRRAVLAIIRQWYWDFGPTLAAVELREVHGCARSRDIATVDDRTQAVARSQAAAKARLSTALFNETALASWSRSTAARTGGLRPAARNARRSCSSTTRPVGRLMHLQFVGS
jgi:hypothetical protein